jgi:hypothetical protein
VITMVVFRHREHTSCQLNHEAGADPSESRITNVERFRSYFLGVKSNDGTQSNTVFVGAQIMDTKLH